MFEKRILKNGITALHVPLQSTKAATVLVLFKAGSRYETKNINGIAHFVEHLMFKGTKKRPSTLDISKALDKYGAEYNAFTSKDHTGYYIKIDAEHFVEAMDILFDMLTNSKLEQKEIDRERKVIFEEIKMYHENPLMHIDDLFEQTLFEGSTLGWNIAGDQESMSKITRQDIVKFIKDYYCPSRTFITVAGNVDQSVFKDMEKGLGRLREPKQVARTWSPCLTDGHQRLGLQFKELEQTQLMLGFPAYHYGDQRNYALSILHAILGGTMSSRLFIAVREKRGLAYSVRTQMGSYEDTGVFAVHAGLDVARLPQALKIIRTELERVVKSGITTRELVEAKSAIKGRIVLQLEESSDLAGWYGKQQIFLDQLETPEERFNKLQKVTQADVLRVAREVIKPARMAAAVIGPFKDEKKLRQYLFA